MLSNCAQGIEAAALASSACACSSCTSSSRRATAAQRASATCKAAARSASPAAAVGRARSWLAGQPWRRGCVGQIPQLVSRLLPQLLLSAAAPWALPTPAPSLTHPRHLQCILHARPVAVRIRHQPGTRLGHAAAQVGTHVVPHSAHCRGREGQAHAVRADGRAGESQRARGKLQLSSMSAQGVPKLPHPSSGRWSAPCRRSRPPRCPHRC